MEISAKVVIVGGVFNYNDDNKKYNFLFKGGGGEWSSTDTPLESIFNDSPEMVQLRLLGVGQLQPQGRKLHLLYQHINIIILVLWKKTIRLNIKHPLHVKI